MTYATQADLVDRFGSRELIELSDRATPPTGAIDAAVVGKALADADGLIDAYVAKRYALPLASTPPRLVRVAGDVARFYLHKDDPTEAVQAAHDEALRFLKDVAAGVAVLDVAGAEPAAAGNTVLIESQDRVFTRKTMEGY